MPKNPQFKCAKQSNETVYQCKMNTALSIFKQTTGAIMAFSFLIFNSKCASFTFPLLYHTLSAVVLVCSSWMLSLCFLENPLESQKSCLNFLLFICVLWSFLATLQCQVFEYFETCIVKSCLHQLAVFFSAFHRSIARFLGALCHHHLIS